MEFLEKEKVIRLLILRKLHLRVILIDATHMHWENMFQLDLNLMRFAVVCVFVVEEEEEPQRDG